MRKMRLKRGDPVIVISGKYKKTVGKIKRVLRESERLIVEGVNVVKRHTKPSLAAGNGGIIAKEVSIHVSNVAYYLSEEKRPTRIGYVFKDGQKRRFSKANSKEIE